ncbi:MAG: hypothetical protein HY297_05055 [Thaumarchaeota archaeon]|nr:hypothetical protein [Nitrososphaerota archaeon]
MSMKVWIAALIVLAFVALFVPFILKTTSAGQFYGAHYQTSSVVSPTYYVFHCGSYVNSGVSAQLGSGFSGFYQLSKGYVFSCMYTTG